MKRKFEVIILGTSSATPTKHRHPSAHFVSIGGKSLLLDCGEGTQCQLAKYGLSTDRISYVLITHLHGDHYFGLPGLICSMALFGRKETLTIIGPPELEEIIKIILSAGHSELLFELRFIKTQSNTIDKISDSEQFELIVVPLKHRIHCTGFIIKEKGPELKLDIVNCEKYFVPSREYSSIKMGSDYISRDQVIIANNLLTTAGYKNRSYAYISDTVYDPDYLVPILSNVDLLYHETTFLHDRVDRASETYHSTSLQAAQIAKAANVKRLLIGHFSARYFDASPLLVEAKSMFPITLEAVEGECIQV